MSKGLKRMGGYKPPEMDRTPLEMPLNFKRPKTLQEIMASMIRQAIDSERDDEHESWDEANDFEEEDPETLDLSRYELQELREEEVRLPEMPQEEQTGDPPDPDAEEPEEP